MEKLKPCPFCGESPEYVTYRDDFGQGHLISCCVSMASRNDRESITMAWNTRVASIPQGTEESIIMRCVLKRLESWAKTAADQPAPSETRKWVLDLIDFGLRGGNPPAPRVDLVDASAIPESKIETAALASYDACIKHYTGLNNPMENPMEVHRDIAKAVIGICEKWPRPQDEEDS